MAPAKWCISNRLLVAVMFGGAAMAQSLPSSHSSAAKTLPPEVSAALPPLPAGARTVMGGAIRNVDPVRDQFELVPVGGKPMKIVYDARTRLYRDGVRTSVLALRPEEHASIETTLDGTKVFAVSIHALSHLPSGDCSGQVLSYDPRTGNLQVNSALSHQPVTLRVPPDTPQEFVGQEATAASRPASFALMAGDLVDVQFQPGSDGRGVVTHISILATPGHTFIFSGELASLDMHSGTMVIESPSNNQSYQVYFYPAELPVSSKLHEGSHVKVTANFDGIHYIAREIKIE